MRVRVWLFVAAAVSAILIGGCGSIVQSKRECTPPPHGSKMEGLVYWLPKGSVIIDGTWDKDAKDCGIKVGTLIEADTSSRWRMKRKVNHLFEDTVLLDVDPATGLLKTVNGTSEDKSAEIVATALQAAAKAMTFGAGGPIGAKMVAEAKGEKCEPFPFPASFHFQIPVEKLAGGYYCATLLITPPPTASPTPTPTPTAIPTVTTNEQPTVTTGGQSLEFIIEVTRIEQPDLNGKNDIGTPMVDGIVVRAPAPYRVKVTKVGPNLSGEQTVFLPDPTRIYYLPLDRMPFVKNETKIALVNGVVQSVGVTRPSIILGIVGVPKTILEALVPLSSH